MLKKQRSETHFCGQKRRGDLTIIREDFISDLRVRGYSEATIRQFLQAVDNCTGWWMARRMALGDFSESALASFVKLYAARCRRRHWPAYRIKLCRQALQRWLGFLREQGWTPPAPVPRSTPARF